MKDLATQYEGFVDAFVNGNEPYNARSRAAFYATLPDLNGKRVLDVGCGYGYDLANYRAKGAECFGIDSSPTMVELARKAVPTAQITRGIMEQLPYANDSFDVVLSKYTLQTSLDVPKSIAEMVRVTRPGGIIAYLAVHPLRQFLEKKKHPKDYFTQEIVESMFFSGTVMAHEPTHTLEEYLNKEFLAACTLQHYEERPDFPAAEQIAGDTYPCYFIIEAQKR